MNTLLVLNINPQVEEDLVDYLLSLECVRGFTTFEVAGHGHHGRLSLAEQVSGRRKRLQVELLVEETQAAQVLAGLEKDVGNDIVWWELPVRRSGYVGDAAERPPDCL